MIRNSFGLFVLVALSACSTQGEPERLADEIPECLPTETMTCDRFAGENYNCTCERGDNLREMLDAYHMQ